MLKRLRTKFVLIIMVLTGSVLVAVLGGTFLSAWQAQHALTWEALDRGIEGDLKNLPRWGEQTISLDEETTTIERTSEIVSRETSTSEWRSSMFVLGLDLDRSGMVVATNDAPLMLDADVLKDVIMRALTSEPDSDWDQSIHVAWKRVRLTSETTRVVICDTSTQDITLKTLLVRDLVITAVAMVLLLAISFGLSTWVLKPVKVAWDQQRQFVSDASHELKTPLAVIIANSQILAADATLTSEQRRWVSSTQDESAHMKGLVEELLELARTDESSAGAAGVMQRTDVDFSSLTESAALEFDAVAFERGTSIECDVEEGLHVVGDPEWLERLVKILIDNACKYSQVGSPVTVSLTAPGRKLRLAVTNHGNVIDAADLPHVFDRFYRTDKARSRDKDTGGFGLGLAIAKGIATSHGGDITCTSSEAAGTCFTLTLPVRVL